MKIADMISKLVAYHPPMEDPFTCDKVKIGDADKECTGLIVACFCSMDVVREAVRSGANFIICHEPLFYNHEDQTEWLKGDPVYEEKRALLEENGIVVYRDHDRIHGGHEGVNYDGIFYGMMKELGWEDYVIGDRKKPLLFEIPETGVKELADELMEKLNLTGIRVVGSRDTVVHRVLFCEHVSGARPFPGQNEDPDNALIRKVREENVDVMIPFEIVDWTLSTYVRDSCAAGRPMTILETGHFNMEELGMKHMIKYLPSVFGEEIPMKYVQSGDTFSYLLR